MAEKIFKFLFSKKAEKKVAITIKRNESSSNLEELERKEICGFNSKEEEANFYRIVKLSHNS